MKKEITFKEFVRNKIKHYKKLKKKNTLNSTDELVKFYKLRRDTENLSLYSLLLPFVVAIWIGIFNIVMFYSLGLDFKIPSLLIIKLFIDIWPFFLMALLTYFILNVISVNSYNQRLIKLIVSERK